MFEEASLLQKVNADMRNVQNVKSVSYEAPQFCHERSTFERVEKFISSDHFVDCNLYGRIYDKGLPVKLRHCDFGGEQIDFSFAVKQLASKGEEVQVGFTFGPTWTCHWFQIDIKIPNEWKHKDVVLRFDAQCEALIWDSEGSPLLGLSSDFGRTELKLKTEPLFQRYFVEALANNRNGDGDGGAIRPAKLDKTFQVKLAEINVQHAAVLELFRDFEILLQIAQFVSKENARHYEALYTANDMINRLVKANFTQSVLEECHQKAQAFFSQPNSHSQLTLYAIGNCHIDTAWLWRYNETKRKCARSWASTVALMGKYKKMTFAVSQAQQLLWVKNAYPLLLEEMQDLSAEGRMSGVGGAWVEFDGNLPSGESMIRQLLYGQREFKKLFGKYSQIFWLPDTFGYSAQLPQIMKHCGMDYFLTQKMSWSLVNKFPHHSFFWYGIDGSSVLAHFPPHHYVAEVTVKECIESASNFTDRGRSNVAVMLYGYGDGGGGPDEKMLERAKRLRDCDGVPRVVHATPEEFFTRLLEDAPNLCCWKGELYLELHNATYTTQARIKKMNRVLESVFRDHEFLQTMQLLECGKASSLHELWKKFLLNQFHDVLPGTCIKEVVKDAMEIYEQIFDTLTENGGRTLKFNGIKEFRDSGNQNDWVVNTASWERIFFYNKMLLVVPPLAVWPLKELKPLDSNFKHDSLITESDSTFVFKNDYFTARLNKVGQIVSYVVKNKVVFPDFDEYEAIEKGSLGNSYVIFDDVPLYWDAWDVMDYHLETRAEVHEVVSAEILENSKLMGRLRVQLQISETSHLLQEICIRVDIPYLLFNVSVDWHESHKFLKVEFPLNFNPADALYDIQYGQIARPTHRNTSWDSAKYLFKNFRKPICAHKWMAAVEYGKGVALLNNCKYGHSCDGNVMRLSLLRASKSPDDLADIGHHEFSYAFFPFIGSLQNTFDGSSSNVIRAAFEFNNPIRFVSGWNQTKTTDIFSIQGSKGIMLDALKPSEDDPNAIILRLFESFGGSCRVRLLLKHGRIISVDLADGLERIIRNLEIDPPIDPVTPNADSVSLEFRAFELKTLIVRLFAI